MKYTIELVWNREFKWCYYKSSEDLDSAITSAKSIRDSGDGDRVKKVRVIDSKTEKVLWNG